MGMELQRFLDHQANKVSAIITMAIGLMSRRLDWNTTGELRTAFEVLCGFCPFTLREGSQSLTLTERSKS